MNRKRTMSRVTRLFARMALVTLLPVSAAHAVYAGGTWTNQAPAVSPSARYMHAMAYLGEDQVLLFGGADNTGDNGETWVYDLSANTWTSHTPAAAPSARRGHAMASLGGGDRVLLFGGEVAGGLSGETWLATGFYSGPWYRTYVPLMTK